MRFLYPLGLLGLIGVPILIIIYIIKNKYTEQTVSSTYLWKLSEKFLKRKKRPPKIAGLLSLILQIVAVVAISFAIAHPVLIFPDAADEYCIIVDASGSMNIEQNGVTRFEIGRERAKNIIEDSTDGSVYTLIYASDDSTTVVCERAEEKSYALQVLNGLTSTYGAAELTDALELAQNYFLENNAIRTYLVTDRKYSNHENVELINVSGDETNFAVLNVNAPKINEAGDGYTVTAQVVAYKETADLLVSLYVDDATQPVSTETVPVFEDGETNVVFDLETGAFNSLKVVIENADALSSDNVCVLYNPKSENSYKTLLVSETPRFLKAVVETVSGAAVETMDAAQYAEAFANKSGDAVDGYGLYIFDSIHPGVLPDDGAVWLFNQTENVEGAEFSVKRQATLQEGVQLGMTKASSKLATQLTKNMSGKDLYVYKYMKYGIFGEFTTLYSYQGESLVFTGNNAYGNREVVFAFSLHDSNFSMLGDFVIFAKNLLDFSFPDVLEKVTYDCGERLQLNAPTACTSIKITAPDGTESYPASNVAANEFVLRQPGVYTVTLTVAGEEKEYHAFAGIPKEERKVSTLESSFNLQGEAGEGGLDGKYDDLIVIFILLGVVFLIDWVVYCYDKYQLR